MCSKQWPQSGVHPCCLIGAFHVRIRFLQTLGFSQTTEGSCNTDQTHTLMYTFAGRQVFLQCSSLYPVLLHNAIFLTRSTDQVLILQGMSALDRSSAIFIQEDNFCNFLFAFLYKAPLRMMRLESTPKEQTSFFDMGDKNHSELPLLMCIYLLTA